MLGLVVSTRPPAEAHVCRVRLFEEVYGLQRLPAARRRRPPGRALGFHGVHHDPRGRLRGLESILPRV